MCCALATRGSAGSSRRLAGAGWSGPWARCACGPIFWGRPLLIPALRPALPVAVVFLATVGVGNLIEDVAGFSILQRIAPDRTMARILGVFEALIRVTAG